MEMDWESRRLFLFCQGRLKVIFLIVSKVVASFPSPSCHTFGGIGLLDITRKGENEK